MSDSFVIARTNSNKYSLFDSNFNKIENTLLENISASVRDSFRAMAINRENVFILCEDGLRVFSLKTYDLIEVIDVFADQMKLIGDRYLAFFSPKFSFLHFYDQVDFEKEDEFDLVDSVEDDLQMTTDNSSFVSFGNLGRMKWASVNF